MTAWGVAATAGSVLGPALGPSRPGRAEAAAPRGHRSDYLLGGVIVLACAVHTVFLQDLMTLFAVKGAIVNAALFSVPSLVALTRLRAGMPGASWRAAAVLVCALSATALYATHWQDSIVRIHAWTTTVLLAAVFATRPGVLAGVAAAGRVVCVASLAAVAVNPDVPRVHYGLALAALSAQVLSRQRWHASDLILMVAALALSYLSTTRAAVLASLPLLLAPFIRTLSRFAFGSLLVACILGGWASLQLASSQAPSAPSPDRSDVVGRMGTVREDRLTNRLDIWEDTARALTSRQVVTGLGIGDVDYFVALAHRKEAVDSRTTEKVLSIHSTVFDVFLCGGLLVAPALIWFAWRLARGASLQRGSSAIVGSILAVNLANSSVYDFGGPALMIAIAVAATSTSVVRAATLTRTQRPEPTPRLAGTAA